MAEEKVVNGLVVFGLTKDEAETYLFLAEGRPLFGWHGRAQDAREQNENLQASQEPAGEKNWSRRASVAPPSSRLYPWNTC